MFALIEAAGWPIWPLVLASIIALAIIGERAWSLRRSIVAPKELLGQVVQEYRQNGVNPQLLARYQQTLNAFCAEVEGFCHRYGVDYLRASTALPFEDLVLKYMRQNGMIK